MVPVQNLKIIFAGSGEFGLPTLKQLVADGHSMVQVFTQPDRPAGRGKKLTPTPIAIAAEEMGLPVQRTADINATPPTPLPPADLLVVIAFGQKISPAVAAHSRLGSINLHASLLPKYRGAAPINWAILNGEKITGNSVIRLAERMDAGDVLGQSEVQIGASETAGELHDRLAIDGAGLMQRVIAELANGSAVPKPQDHSAATVAKKLSRETAVIDWARPAMEVARWINGLSPWPGCRVRILDGDAELARLTLLRALVNRATDGGAGGIIQPDGSVGGLEILQVQPAGKRPMSLADYQRGNRWDAGLRVESLI